MAEEIASPVIIRGWILVLIANKNEVRWVEAIDVEICKTNIIATLQICL